MTCQRQETALGWYCPVHESTGLLTDLTCAAAGTRFSRIYEDKSHFLTCPRRGNPNERCSCYDWVE